MYNRCCMMSSTCVLDTLNRTQRDTVLNFSFRDLNLTCNLFYFFSLMRIEVKQDIQCENMNYSCIVDKIYIKCYLYIYDYYFWIIKKTTFISDYER